MSATEDRSSSASAEDYVKAVYSLTQGGERAASTSDLARRLGITPGSVSTMIKRLDAGGLVEHVPYHGVRLTADGQQLALSVIRRHRLLEQFLHETLQIAWDDVDRFAERLEHAVDDDLVAIIAAKLGDPTTDPHGDPIPDRELTIDDPDTRRLDELPAGEEAVIVRVSDSNPDLLRYLTQLQIGIGDRVATIAHQPFGGPCLVRIAGREHALGIQVARAIRIR